MIPNNKFNSILEVGIGTGAIAEKVFESLGTRFTKNELINLFRNNPELITITEKINKKWELNYEKNKTVKKFKSTKKFEKS